MHFDFSFHLIVCVFELLLRLQQMSLPLNFQNLHQSHFTINAQIFLIELTHCDRIINGLIILGKSAFQVNP